MWPAPHRAASLQQTHGLHCNHAVVMPLIRSSSSSRGLLQCCSCPQPPGMQLCNYTKTPLAMASGSQARATCSTIGLRSLIIPAQQPLSSTASPFCVAPNWAATQYYSLQASSCWASRHGSPAGGHLHSAGASEAPAPCCLSAYAPSSGSAAICQHGFVTHPQRFLGRRGQQAHPAGMPPAEASMCCLQRGAGARPRSQPLDVMLYMATVSHKRRRLLPQTVSRCPWTQPTLSAHNLTSKT